MNKLDSVVVILMGEALIALVLVMVGLYFWSRKKKSSELQIAHHLIDELDDTKVVRTEKLKQLISKNCTLTPQELQILLKDVDYREKALYQQIIQIFLNRDPAILKAVDEYIQDLAMPYCSMLKQAANSGAALVPPPERIELSVAKQEIIRLMDENGVLSEQLQLALKTVDEMSAEYASMFGGSKNESELRAGCQRLLDIFQSIEDELKNRLVKL